jgi:rhomboid protease GluP
MPCRAASRGTRNISPRRSHEPRDPGPEPRLSSKVEGVFKRQTEGSVICTSCGVLVGVNDATCYNCNRRNPGLWGFAPAFRRLGNDLGFVPLVVGATVALYVLALLASRSGIQTMLAPRTDILFALGSSGAVPVFRFGRWWTVLTAGWLHAGVLHILFNVLWIRQLGPAVADLYGPGRMVIIYTLSGVVGFAFTSVAGEFLGYYLNALPVIGGLLARLLGGAGFSVGASAPIFGLLGALVYYGRRTGSRHVGDAGLQYALMMGLFGLIMPGIDNQAHLGGFVGGYVAGRLLDPLKPERIDPMVTAVVCLVVTAVAIAASVVTALPVLTR